MINGGSEQLHFINYKLAPLTMFQNILTTESDTIKKLKDIFKVLKDDELNKMKVEELQEYYKTVCGSDYGVLSNVILQDRENMRIDIYENMVKKLKLYFQFMPKKMFENYYNIVCNPEKLTEEQSKHKYKYEDKAEIIKQYEYCGKVMEKFWSDFYNFYGNKLEPKSDVKGIIPVKKSDVIIKSTAKRLFDEYNLFLKEITAHSNLDTVISNLMNQIPNIAITEENKNHYISFIKEYIQECIEVMYDQKRVNKEDLVDKESPYLEQRYTDKAEIFYNNLQSLLMQKKLIQAGSLDIFTKTPENDEYNYFGLSAKHYYTVLGVHTQIINGENIKLIRLRDPRAVETLGYKILDKKLIPFKQKEYTNGIFLIELNDFIKYFKTIGNN